MNKVTIMINSKGFTLKEFLSIIDRGNDWYYHHSNGGKDYDFLMLSIKGLEDKS